MINYQGKYPMYSDIYGTANNSNNNMNNYYHTNNISKSNQPSMYLPSGVELPDEDDKDDDSDIQYMKGMYPDFCKKIQAYVDEECDKLEYDGSYMYDEYPDRETVEQITDKINDSVGKDENLKSKEQDVVESEVVDMQFRRSEDYQRDIIKILLLNEIFNRRRHRFYGGRYKKISPYYPPYYYNYRQYFY